MVFLGDQTLEVEYSVAVECASFVNLIRAGRELQSLAARGRDRATAPSKSLLYKPIETRKDLDDWKTSMNGTDDHVVRLLDDDDEWDDDTVECLFSTSAEDDVRELVFIETNELNSTLDSVLPPDHRIKIEWSNGGNSDDINDMYMRVMVKFDAVCCAPLCQDQTPRSRSPLSGVRDQRELPEHCI
jgi:hypothetical protein